MRTRASTWGAVAGASAGLLILSVLSVMLLNTDGANYKVLVAPWLWLLPVTGFFAGLGYAAGTIIETVASARVWRRRKGP